MQWITCYVETCRIRHEEAHIRANLSNRRIRRYLVCRLKRPEARDFSHVRFTTSKDNKVFKNSIITFMKINEKEWSRLIRNKRILYKRE